MASNDEVIGVWLQVEEDGWLSRPCYLAATPHPDRQAQMPALQHALPTSYGGVLQGTVLQVVAQLVSTRTRTLVRFHVLRASEAT